MKTITVYGASDDLIEIDGAIKEEFGWYDSGSKPAYLAFSDGTVLSVIYTDDGMWRINRVATGTALYSKTEATDGDTDYSDRVSLQGDIAWVVFGQQFEKAPK